MVALFQLGLEEANVILQGSLVEAGKIGVAMVIAVVDQGGHLIALSRMDESKFTSTAMAIDKAFTAAGAKRRTSAYTSPASAGKPAFGLHVTNRGRFSIIGGGVPVLYRSCVAGAVGCASGTPEQDEQVALAGIAVLAKRLDEIRAGD